MKLIKNNFIILILILAAFLRFTNIGNFPSLNPDEAALGYNAYSLIQTGRDEHGAAWPLHFQSFNDFKPGGYVYLDLPFIKIFGLNPLAVRLPNLIFSLVAVYTLYLLVILLTQNQSLALLSAFILSVNPWHIHFSRGAWETSTALTFILLGIYFFFKSVLKNRFSILDFSFSLLFFCLSLYIYHSARLVAPLIFFVLALTYSSTLLKNFKSVIIPAIIGVLIVIPVMYSFIHTGGATRFGGVGLTADKGPVNRAEELLNQHGNTKLINRIVHNKRALYLISWGEKYFSHFDLNFLYLTGDQVPRSKSPDMGQFYLFELPFTFLGLFFLFRDHIFDSRSKIFMVAFALIAPIASSLTFQAPSALRSFSLSVPLTIFTALGIYYFYLLITPKFKPYFGLILVLAYTFSLAYYLDAYFVHAPRRFPFAWNTGFDQVISYINSQKGNYQNVYFTDKYDQPYILYLFYSQYSPASAQTQTKLTPPDQFGFSTVRSIDNIHFGPINWSQIPSKSLVVAADDKISAAPVKTFAFPNGSPGFTIYIK